MKAILSLIYQGHLNRQYEIVHMQKPELWTILQQPASNNKKFKHVAIKELVMMVAESKLDR